MEQNEHTHRERERDRKRGSRVRVRIHPPHTLRDKGRVGRKNRGSKKEGKMYLYLTISEKEPFVPR